MSHRAAAGPHGIEPQRSRSLQAFEHLFVELELELIQTQMAALVRWGIFWVGTYFICLEIRKSREKRTSFCQKM
jgi:hypothetical protein